MLSLGDPRDDTLEGDENAQLMPIGGPSNVVDANPVPIKLDQINVDSVIANIVQHELLAEGNDFTAKADVSTAKADDSSKTRVDDEELEEGEGEEKPSQVTRPSSATPTQGSLKIKTHVLKKKASVKRTYKCTVCRTTRSSVQLINEHHLKDHKPQICPTCGKTYALASTLIKHIYEHEEQRFHCDACDFSSHLRVNLIHIR